MLDKILSNASLKVVSFIIAIVLWFVVLGSRNVESTKEVPLEIITPADLVVSNDVPDKVAFRLSGPKAFLRNILNRREEPIRVNLSSAKSGVVTYRFFSDNIQLPLGVKVISITPTAVAVNLEPLRHKELTVRLVTNGKVPDEFKLTKLALLSKTVRVRGADSRIDNLREISTMEFDLSQLRESGEKEIALDLSRLAGVRVEGELPKVHFEVVQSLANFKIRNADIKVLTNRRFTVEPREVAMFVRCGPEELRKLDVSKVYALVDLRNKGPGIYEQQFTVHLPAGIKLIKVVPPKAKITLH